MASLTPPDAEPKMSVDYAKVASDLLEKSKEKETILEEAHRLVNGPRQATYSHPFDDFGRTAKIWEGITGHPFTEEEVALCMIGVKMSRLVSTPGHHDSMVDVAGYLLTYEMVRERRAAEIEEDRSVGP